MDWSQTLIYLDASNVLGVDDGLTAGTTSMPEMCRVGAKDGVLINSLADIALSVCV